MANGMITGDNTPKSLANSFESMQQVARGLVTAAYDGIEPDTDELQELRDHYQACSAEFAEFERTYDRYPYQGTLRIRNQAYLDTVRMLEQVLARGSKSYGKH